jgi:Trk K+ transport system NAD-binding subunit
MAETYIVAGSDGIAVRLAEELVALGERVVVLSHDMKPRFRTHLETLDIRVIAGDARDVADLRTAGLETAAALAIVEEDDVANPFEVRALSAEDDMQGVLAVASFDASSGTATLFPDPAPGVLALVPDVD